VVAILLQAISTFSVVVVL